MKGQVCEIHEDDFDSETMEQLIYFLYYQKLEVEPVGEMIAKLHNLAIRYNVISLVKIFRAKTKLFWPKRHFV